MKGLYTKTKKKRREILKCLLQAQEKEFQEGLQAFQNEYGRIRTIRMIKTQSFEGYSLCHLLIKMNYYQTLRSIIAQLGTFILKFRSLYYSVTNKVGQHGPTRKMERE